MPEGEQAQRRYTTTSDLEAWIALRLVPTLQANYLGNLGNADHLFRRIEEAMGGFKT